MDATSSRQTAREPHALVSQQDFLSDLRGQMKKRLEPSHLLQALRANYSLARGNLLSFLNLFSSSIAQQWLKQKDPKYIAS